MNEIENTEITFYSPLESNLFTILALIYYGPPQSYGVIHQIYSYMPIGIGKPKVSRCDFCVLIGHQGSRSGIIISRPRRLQPTLSTSHEYFCTFCEGCVP